MSDSTPQSSDEPGSAERRGLPLGKLGAALVLCLLLGSLAWPGTRALWLLELARRTGGDTHAWCLDRLVELEEDGVAPLVVLSAEALDRAHDPGVAAGVAPLPDSIPYPLVLNRLSRLAGRSAEVRHRLAGALGTGAPLVVVSLALIPHVRRVPADKTSAGTPSLDQALAQRWVEHEEERAALLRLTPWLLPVDARPWQPVPSELLQRPCRLSDLGIPPPNARNPALPGEVVAQALRKALGGRLTLSPAMTTKLEDPCQVTGRESSVREMLRAFGGSDELRSSFGHSKETMAHTFYRASGTPTVRVFRDGAVHIMTEAETAPLWDAKFRRLAAADK